MAALQEFRRSVSMKVAFDRVGVDRNTISRTAAIAELSLASPEVFHALAPWDEKEETLAHYALRCRQAMDDDIKAKIKTMKAKGELLPIVSKWRIQIDLITLMHTSLSVVEFRLAWTFRRDEKDSVCLAKFVKAMRDRISQSRCHYALIHTLSGLTLIQGTYDILSDEARMFWTSGISPTQKRKFGTNRKHILPLPSESMVLNSLFQEQHCTVIGIVSSLMYFWWLWGWITDAHICNYRRRISLSATYLLHFSLYVCETSVQYCGGKDVFKNFFILLSPKLFINIWCCSHGSSELIIIKFHPLRNMWPFAVCHPLAIRTIKQGLFGLFFVTFCSSFDAPASSLINNWLLCIQASAALSFSLLFFTQSSVYSVT